MDTTDEWIPQRTGIRERRFARQGNLVRRPRGSRPRRTPSRTRGSPPADIDLIVFATMTPAHYFPGNGGLLAAQPRARRRRTRSTSGCSARDSSRASRSPTRSSARARPGGSCSSAPNATRRSSRGATPSGRSSSANRTRPPRPSRYAWGTAHRDRAVIFGDGGGAFVLEANEADDGRGFLGFEMRTDGTPLGQALRSRRRLGELPLLLAGDVRGQPDDPDRRGTPGLSASPRRPCRRSSARSLARHGLGVADLDLLLMHQANLRINEAVQKTLGLPDERVFNNIQKYGNTTAATLPLVFHEAKQAGRIRQRRPRRVHGARRRPPLGRRAPARLDDPDLQDFVRARPRRRGASILRAAAFEEEPMSGYSTFARSSSLAAALLGGPAPRRRRRRGPAAAPGGRPKDRSSSIFPRPTRTRAGSCSSSSITDSPNRCRTATPLLLLVLLAGPGRPRRLRTCPVRQSETGVLRGQELEDYEFFGKWSFFAPAGGPFARGGPGGRRLATSAPSADRSTKPLELLRAGNPRLHDRLRGSASPRCRPISRTAVTAGRVPPIDPRTSSTCSVARLRRDHRARSTSTARSSRARRLAPASGWIAAVEKTVLRHRFSFTVGNLRGDDGGSVRALATAVQHPLAAATSTSASTSCGSGS